MRVYCLGAGLGGFRSDTAAVAFTSVCAVMGKGMGAAAWGCSWEQQTKTVRSLWQRLHNEGSVSRQVLFISHPSE